MQQNFKVLEQNKPGKKYLNGVELIWSEPDQLYMFPMPEQAKHRLLLDEKTGTFFPVMNGEQMMYREREATAPDGTTMRETVIFRDAATITEADLEQQRLVARALRIRWQIETLETLVKMRPVFVAGLFISMLCFFWNLIQAMNANAKIVAVAASSALAEVLHVGMYAVGILGGILLLRFILPIIFSIGSEEEAELQYQTEKQPQKTGDVIINVQQGNGVFGSQSEAQQIVTNREFL